MIIALYISAIVASDLLITHFGPVLLPVTSFFLIPFDLVVRDVLHDKWRAQGTLKFKMPTLILSGSVISFLLNHNSKNIALGSFSAFMVAGLVAGIIYQALGNKARLVRMNVANFFAAMTDSFVFQAIAFGSVSLQIVLIQWFLKFIGGSFWSFLFVKMMKGKNENSGN